jgi:hypothetical protein
VVVILKTPQQPVNPFTNYPVTDEPDLTLLGRRIEKIESDVRSLREAGEDMTASLSRRLSAIEVSQRVLEDRVTTLETRTVATIFARLRAQIEEVPPATTADR